MLMVHVRKIVGFCLLLVCVTSFLFASWKDFAISANCKRRSESSFLVTYIFTFYPQVRRHPYLDVSNNIYSGILTCYFRATFWNCEESQFYGLCLIYENVFSYQSYTLKLRVQLSSMSSKSKYLWHLSTILNVTLMTSLYCSLFVLNR